MATRKQAPSKTKKGAGKATKKADVAPSGLPWGREHFCLEYVKDGNATRSAIAAGYSRNSASEQGYDLLRNPQIKARIAELQREIAQELKIEHADILKRMWDTATGDPNDLVRVERRSCRYCHGVDHQYQWKTEREYRDAVNAFLHGIAGNDHKALIALGEVIDAGNTVPGMPDDEGGYGYDATAAPSLDCPECFGEGVTTVQLSDSREAMSHPLYEGVKQTKDGIEVKIADRAKALEQVARHLSFFKDEVKLGASAELLEAARKINAASPPLDPAYMRDNASRLMDDEGGT
ncbi:terminase small subunit [Roseovarius nitratireducens]|uniref:terminase small subunit n=1 Tax=Roseovarius nitratireducens TaxID=2044597 RepID=UPI000CE20984|nr:terminase small subunit [Roseovarius nitratireducens]